MTVLGSITDILVTELLVGVPPASLRAVPGWAGRGEEEVTETEGPKQPLKPALDLDQRGISRGPPESRCPSGGLCGETGCPKPPALQCEFPASWLLINE